jgi:hypothetical protein
VGSCFFCSGLKALYYGRLCWYGIFLKIKKIKDSKYMNDLWEFDFNSNLWKKMMIGGIIP